MLCPHIEIPYGSNTYDFIIGINVDPSWFKLFEPAVFNRYIKNIYQNLLEFIEFLIY